MTGGWKFAGTLAIRTLEQHDQLQDPRDEWGSVPLPAFLRQ